MVEKYLRNANLFDRKYFYLNSCQGGRGFPTSISRACSIDSLNNVKMKNLKIIWNAFKKIFRMVTCVMPHFRRENHRYGYARSAKRSFRSAKMQNSRQVLQFSFLHVQIQQLVSTYTLQAFKSPVLTCTAIQRIHSFKTLDDFLQVLKQVSINY